MTTTKFIRAYTLVKIVSILFLNSSAFKLNDFLSLMALEDNSPGNIPVQGALLEVENYCEGKILLIYNIDQCSNVKPYMETVAAHREMYAHECVLIIFRNLEHPPITNYADNKTDIDEAKKLIREVHDRPCEFNRDLIGNEETWKFILDQFPIPAIYFTLIKQQENNNNDFLENFWVRTTLNKFSRTMSNEFNDNNNNGSYAFPCSDISSLSNFVQRIYDHVHHTDDAESEKRSFLFTSLQISSGILILVVSVISLCVIKVIRFQTNQRTSTLEDGIKVENPSLFKLPKLICKAANKKRQILSDGICNDKYKLKLISKPASGVEIWEREKTGGILIDGPEMSISAINSIAISKPQNSKLEMTGSDIKFGVALSSRELLRRPDISPTPNNSTSDVSDSEAENFGFNEDQTQELITTRNARMHLQAVKALRDT